MSEFKACGREFGWVVEKNNIKLWVLEILFKI